MVEEGAAERALEEVVRNGIGGMVFLVQVVIDRQGPGVEHPHGEPGRIAAGHISILLSTIELILLLVVAVNDVAGAAARLATPIRDAKGSKDARRWARGVRRLDEGIDVKR